MNSILTITAALPASSARYFVAKVSSWRCCTSARPLNEITPPELLAVL
jgi:hypothetical protein